MQTSRTSQNSIRQNLFRDSFMHLAAFTCLHFFPGRDRFQRNDFYYLSNICDATSRYTTMHKESSLRHLLGLDDTRHVPFPPPDIFSKVKPLPRYRNLQIRFRSNVWSILLSLSKEFLVALKINSNAEIKIILE